MEPRLISAALAAGLITVAAPLQAGPHDQVEFIAMAYVSIPFGGTVRTDGPPVVGLMVNHSLSEQRHREAYQPALFRSTFASAEHALVDLRFNPRQNKWHSFHVGGIDAFTYETRLNADGSVVTGVAGFSTEAIIAGVVVAGVAIHAATKKDNKSSSANSNPSFETPPSPG